jgi:hypothetical protein
MASVGSDMFGTPVELAAQRRASFASDAVLNSQSSACPSGNAGAEAMRLVSRFIAAIMRTSASVNVPQVRVVMRNMASCSDLRCTEKSAPELARDSTVPGWDSLGRWRVTVFRNLRDS